MSQTKANLAFKEPGEVTPLIVDKLTLSSTGKKIVISKVAQLLFNYGSKKTFAKGQYMIREGHSDKSVFILLSGEVDILKKDKNGNVRIVSKIRDAGTILGEMSIFLDEARTSSVRVSEDALVLVFTGESFLAAIVNTPELAMRILKSLSNKLKIANERIIQNSFSENSEKEVDEYIDEESDENSGDSISISE